MASSSPPRASDGDDIVYVPVRSSQLDAVYRVLVGAPAPPAPAERPPRRASQTMIDLIEQVARDLDADQRPVALEDLYDEYHRAYPGIGKGATRESFNSAAHFHTVNMRSRFQDPKNRRKPAPWLTRPTFKRVAHARYQLLTDDDLARFHQAVEQNNPLVYQDEYGIADLPPIP